MPTNVSLRNILFSTMKDQCRPLLVVDFIDYYQKYPFEKRGADSILKVKNCLFLFN